MKTCQQSSSLLSGIAQHNGPVSRTMYLEPTLIRLIKKYLSGEFSIEIRTH